MTNNNNENVTFSFFSKAKSANGDKPASPDLIKFYYDLCTQKRRTPVEGVEAMSQDTVRDMVDELKTYYPASDKQISIILEKSSLLANAGHPVNIDIEKLTGGFNGTASVVINELFELEKKYVKSKPTIPQLEFVVGMFCCPAVDFESEGISRKVELENDQWRFCTPDEFVTRIKEHFTKEELSSFINKFRGEFNDWKSTRIRPGQFNYIKTLLERTDSIVDDIVLQMMNQDEAQKYIEQLLNELKRKPQTSFLEISDQEPPRNTDITDSIEADEKYVTDTVYRLMSETGYEPTNIDEILKDGKALKEYIIYLVQECYIEPEELAHMMEDSTILQDLFKDDVVKTA